MRGEHRFIVHGAGAVGGAIGGMLQHAGADVVLIARGAQLEALREGALRIDLPSRSLRVAVEVAGHPREIAFGPRDVVILCTKSQDTPGALADLAAAAPRATPVFCAQNGVGNEALAAARFDRVYGVVVFAPLAFVEPGRVEIHSEPALGGLDLGLHPEGSDALAGAVARDLSEAGFDARVEPRILRLKYGKLLSNLGNAVQALAGRAGFEGPLVGELIAEAEACYRAAGIDYLPLAELYERYSHITDQPVNGNPRGGGSTWQSLLRRTGSIEVDALNGEIVRLGERFGVPTPQNRALAALALRAAAEGWPPGRMSAGELAAAVAAG